MVLERASELAWFTDRCPNASFDAPNLPASARRHACPSACRGGACDNAAAVHGGAASGSAGTPPAAAAGPACGPRPERRPGRALGHGGSGSSGCSGPAAAAAGTGLGACLGSGGGCRQRSLPCSAGVLAGDGQPGIAAGGCCSSAVQPGGTPVPHKCAGMGRPCRLAAVAARGWQQCC